jgi:hypothetical protein
MRKPILGTSSNNGVVQALSTSYCLCKMRKFYQTAYVESRTLKTETASSCKLDGRGWMAIEFPCA